VSDGDAYAGQTHSPPNNPSSVVAPGGGGAAVPSSVVRGGEASPPRAPAHDADLPGVHLLPSQFDEVRAPSGILAEMRLKAGSRLSDRGSHGKCGFLCLAFALMIQGKLPFLDAAAYASPTLRDHHLARALICVLICAHGRHLTTQVAMVAQDGTGSWARAVASRSLSPQQC